LSNEGTLRAVAGPHFEEVLAAARDGQEWAWAAMFGDLAGPLFGYLRAQGSRDPEDLLSEVFLQVARNLRTFTGTEAGFRSWVFTVAHSRIIDERRRRRRHPVDPVASIADLVPAQDDITSGAALDAVMSDGVEAILQRLAPAQRDVLLLRIVAGLTVPEVAALVRRSEGAVKALQRRGLDELRRRFDLEGIPR